MAINFPTPATVGETFTDSVTGITFTWNGYGWTQGGTAAPPTPVDAYTKAESDANFVNVPGDTMTGNLTVSMDAPHVLLNRTGTSQAVVGGQKGGVNRWQ